MNGRAIVDYAEDGDTTGFRDALYSGIMDRVQAHIEAKKQEIARNLISQDYYEEDGYSEEELDNSDSEE